MLSFQKLLQNNSNTIRILPVAAVVALVALFGVRMVNNSHAEPITDANIPLTCSISYAQDGNYSKYKVTATNDSKTSTSLPVSISISYSGSYLYNGVLRSTNLGQIEPTETKTWTGSYYAPHADGTFHGAWATSATKGTCSGDKKLTW